MLDELTGGDHELAEAILSDYFDSLGIDLAALRVTIAGDDADAVRRHAHRIRGASRTVGTHNIARVAETLEALASASVEDWPSLRSTAEELGVTMARVAAATRAHCRADRSTRWTTERHIDGLNFDNNRTTII